MAREVSVRELRNHTSEVVAAVRSGEAVSLTVNRTPVADIVPHAAADPWVPGATLREILDEAGADARLLDDLADIRNRLVDE
ncbi:MAG: type II toxin-antitoxin system Phd/YefM family antitoxin [Solirubrobacterales bacterium]